MNSRSVLHGDDLARRIAALAAGEESDPFAILGMHADLTTGTHIVRAFVPEARAISVVSKGTGEELVELRSGDPPGMFSGSIAGKDCPRHYCLRVTSASGTHEIDDPYTFGAALEKLNISGRVREGRHRTYEVLGAHSVVLDDTPGTVFAVWAPNARRVSVVGDFNAWDGRRHPMRVEPESGIWQIFLPGVDEGALYKYEIRTKHGESLLKADPYAFRCERPPNTASIVQRLPEPAVPELPSTIRSDHRAPIAIYEVHLGSWRRSDDNGALSYDQLADQLIRYVKDMGFTHIELLPIAEHPFDGSWGYQPTGLYAPTSRFGSPEEFRAFSDRCREEGVGLILDWVAAHFPNDPHGLATFDGTALYEHADPREGRHPDWGTLIYNYARNEVRDFLLSNALFWIERYGVSGLRVDAVASMIYRNYSRKYGEWIPNQYGGVENLEAVDLLKQANELIYAVCPNGMTVAEESTAWPMVSRPTYVGGLGFGYKWNLGWMHDTLSYMSMDPIYRSYHHDQLTFGLLYAFNENFILSLSHDEVVHGKGSLLGKMPGDTWQKFANLRAYLGFQYTHPGKKLLFMGDEFAQLREWNHDTSLDWHLLDDSMHKGVQELVRNLNNLYCSWPALHEQDCEPDGFSWIDCHDRTNSVMSFLRRASNEDDYAVVICNFTPVVRYGYRIGVPLPGNYHERLNTDLSFYGGSGVANREAIVADPTPAHGFPCSITLTLPPLATLVLARRTAPV